MTARKSQVKRVLLAILLGMLVSSTAAFGEDKGKAKAASGKETSAVKVVPSHRVRLGGVTVGGFYSRYSGPYYRFYPYLYSPFFWGVYDPYWSLYNPFYYPGLYSGFAAPRSGGQIKLQTKPKSAEVFIDGAYAGAAKDLKSFWLEPGTYDLEVKAENHLPFKQRIYILTGKTLKITAALSPEKQEVKP